MTNKQWDALVEWTTPSEGKESTPGEPEPFLRDGVRALRAIADAIENERKEVRVMEKELDEAKSQARRYRKKLEEASALWAEKKHSLECERDEYRAATGRLLAVLIGIKDFLEFAGVITDAEARFVIRKAREAIQREEGVKS